MTLPYVLRFIPILFLGLIYGVVAATPGFYNAPYFVSRGISEYAVGLVYVVAALGSIAALLVFHTLLIHLGARRLLWVSSLGTLFGLLLLATGSIIGVVAGYIVYLSLSLLLFALLDILLEADTGIHEEVTGRVRGLYLTMVNLSFVIGPFLGGLFISEVSYQFMYVFLAATTILFLLFADQRMRSFTDPVYAPISTHYVVWSIFRNPMIQKVLVIGFLLRCFYVVTLLYLALFLVAQAGLSIVEVGIVGSIAILPFIFIQYPLGFLGDTRFGEKELMVAGFALIALGCFALLWVPATMFWITVVLVIAHIGAATVEVLSESYFFKHIKASDDAHIVAFRLLVPLGYLITSIIATVALLFTSISGVFLITGVCMILGMLHTLTLKDTR